ncbi:hypothetical protein L1049_010589 [Liquidambar formosana]|uniref:PAP-specific phosphatase, mitochondrial n=1 Tax=Liquidambar formosana TaxID=63359 RepID=A0AAP0N8S9_LIQFO
MQFRSHCSISHLCHSNRFTQKALSLKSQPTFIFPAMDLVHSCSRFPTVPSIHPHRSSTHLRNPSLRFFTVRSTLLPFPKQKAKYYPELEAAVDVVERACRICLDVKTSLLSNEERILEKNDQTPVTVADFGVQALISLELGRLFPSIPLVAEEDSSFLRSNNLADLVVNEVADKASFGDKSLTSADVLEAIDRGGKDAFAFGARPATYWVLDPIDGTKGFLKGSEALYVVGLALVVEGEIVLGVMGCPNWQHDFSNRSTTGSGVIMVAHLGCGTWTKSLPDTVGSSAKVPDCWTRCFVDRCCLVHEARFCIPDSQTWDLLPLSAFFNATTNADNIGDKQILLLPLCCGSLCKYLMVASGRASVFILRARFQKIMKVTY